MGHAGRVLVVTLAMACPFEPVEKQALLEAPTDADRAAHVAGAVADGRGRAHRLPPGSFGELKASPMQQEADPIRHCHPHTAPGDDPVCWRFWSARLTKAPLEYDRDGQ